VCTKNKIDKMFYVRNGIVIVLIIFLIIFLFQDLSLAKVYRGDGTYRLRAGDSVIASNNIRLNVTTIELNSFSFNNYENEAEIELEGGNELGDMCNYGLPETIRLFVKELPIKKEWCGLELTIKSVRGEWKKDQTTQGEWVEIGVKSKQYFKTFTIEFYPGWNMFSSPIDFCPIFGYFHVKVIENTCGDLDLWHYSASIVKEYTNSKVIGSRSAYWFKVNKRCHITLWGPPAPYNYDERGVLLYKGWNQIGVGYEEVRWDDIKGNCELLSGPWRWNPITQSYEKPKNGILKPGEGYWVKVKETCRSGKGIERVSIPTPPE